MSGLKRTVPSYFLSLRFKGRSCSSAVTDITYQYTKTFSSGYIFFQISNPSFCHILPCPPLGKICLTRPLDSKCSFCHKTSRLCHSKILTYRRLSAADSCVSNFYRFHSYSVYFLLGNTGLLRGTAALESGASLSRHCSVNFLSLL